MKIYVIDCLDSGTETSRILADMAAEGMIALYRPSESGNMLKRLCVDVNEKMVADDTMLYVFGQERFGELKRDQKLAKEDDVKDNGFVNDIFQGLSFNIGSADTARFDTYRKALLYLLDNGPLAGVHVVIQVDKSDKLLFEDYISAKTVRARFKHLVILRTDLRLAMSMGVSDEIKVEMISDDMERLRAYYYFDEDGSYTLFSPYEFTNTNQLISYLKWLQMQVLKT